MLGFSALVAGSFSLGHLATPFIAPEALTAARFVLSALLVGLAANLTIGIPRSALRAAWRYGVLGGLMGIYFVLMFEGLKTASAVSTAAVFTMTPLMSAGFGWVLMRQRLTARMTMALALGAAGALWVIFRADVAALLAWNVGRGEQVFFVGCVAHALYTPLVRRLNRGEAALVFATGTMVGGALTVGLWGWRDVMATDWTALPVIVWVCLLYISVAATGTTFVLIQFASLRLPAAKVMAYTYLVPSWVILWELTLGKGGPPLAVLGGVALTVLALGMLLKE
jgi:drug/metabolite transporter (DMT)-like permease